MLREALSQLPSNALHGQKFRATQTDVEVIDKAEMLTDKSDAIHFKCCVENTKMRKNQVKQTFIISNSDPNCNSLELWFWLTLEN